MSLLVRNTEHKCKLSCFNRIKQSYYTTPENVLDGTPCSYDHPSDLCVQGECVQVGCDRILGSPMQEDVCGICGGDGTKCAIQVSFMSLLHLIVLYAGADDEEKDQPRLQQGDGCSPRCQED